MKRWIECLHIGQLIILLVALALLAGSGWVAAVLSYEAATTAAYELERWTGPVLTEEYPAEDPIEDYLQNHGRRLEGRVGRFQTLVWVSSGVIAFSALAAGALLWVWFGGRKTEARRRHGR